MPLLIVALICIAGQTSSAPATGNVRLKNGDSVRITQILDSHQRKAWGPSGTRLPFSPEGFLQIVVPRDGKPTPNPKNELAVIAELVRPSKDLEGFDVAFRLGGSSDPVPSGFSFQEAVTRGKISRWTVGVLHEFKAGSDDVSIGVAEGPWTTKASYAVANGRLKHTAGLEIHPALSIQHRKATPKIAHDEYPISVDVKVKLPSGVSSSAFRIAVFSRDGKQFSSSGHMSDPGSRLPIEYWFVGPNPDVARIELQTRPYEWTTFKSVALKPKS